MTSQQISPNQLIAQAATSALAISVMATALGMLAATAAVPAGIPAVDRGIRDLKETFGSDLVALAIKNVGKDDILILAKEVGDLYTDKMRKRYGDWETTSALAAAPPGDLRTANEIAATLAGQGVTVLSAPDVRQKAVVAGEKKARGKRVAQPVKDTRTGIRYDSKAKAGMAVATEYNLDPKNHFAWYEVIKKDPERFVKV